MSAMCPGPGGIGFEWASKTLVLGHLCPDCFSSPIENFFQAIMRIGIKFILHLAAELAPEQGACIGDVERLEDDDLLNSL